MKPFLKWAGGKYKIIDKILEALPGGTRLIEPFVGSGAVFLNAAKFNTYLLADTNSDLIYLYKNIQKDGENFVDYSIDLFKAENNTAEKFYDFRAEFNDCKDVKRRAALFIYLNRHCFNGLCRYNSKGKFNVPFGSIKNPQYPYEEVINFYVKSQQADFILSDFRSTMEMAKVGDVVYCDPPYAPLTLTSNFSDYTQEPFGKNDHRALAKTSILLKSKGIPVIVSNHDTDFTRGLYASATVSNFDVQRFISSKGGNRGKAPELIASFL